ncbi:succinate dehydrogenase cytochrome b subunit [Flavobacterium sp. F-328]|uniref:Succinate dehydrogenase cytochrome b subunit n=2 Tax=Flavobacterium TaxID=237 RepID=A0ABR7JCG2_9FLAO|nr:MULTISPECIES: succinate dehydrogenase cytochrome b subunit [Flavobacterium]MBC5862182.1 succinate dehydrogenase cytochrome b subunit [Flavobacterium turcicum]MBQ0907540.1 succinate dehydrogenase cytochrome b subunit [Flavobacterium erciyesense]MCF6139969.1 succinate dehydrogenase cytochrome b subunit [Flavobacterium sp. K77]NHL00913.1 succinate dehydrogenase cytochrome b subunit [Flavobacterium turcicum]
MAKSALLKSSIAKKVAMALSGLFLILFLAQHFFINSTSVFSPDTFNSISHFMGNNPLVQFVIQPILIVGVIFHFAMGIALDFQNKSARPIKYVQNNGAANSSWASRNMIVSGLVVLAFILLHFYDFWIPEMVYKYVDVQPLDETRYFGELQHKFVDPIRTAIYCVSFVLLSLHLWHGFNSSFQSVGFNNKYSRALHKLGYAFAIVVPFGFIFIALFHHFNH